MNVNPLAARQGYSTGGAGALVRHQQLRIFLLFPWTQRDVPTKAGKFQYIGIQCAGCGIEQNAIPEDITGQQRTKRNLVFCIVVIRQIATLHVISFFFLIFRLLRLFTMKSVSLTGFFFSYSCDTGMPVLLSAQRYSEFFSQDIFTL